VRVKKESFDIFKKVVMYISKDLAKYRVGLGYGV
jgi:hypothetical protein